MICLPHRVERSNRSGKVCWERCGVVLWDVLYAVVYHDHYSPLGPAHSTGAPRWRGLLVGESVSGAVAGGTRRHGLCSIVY